MALFLNQFFHPSTAATSQYLGDAVTSSSLVICGPADYSAVNDSPAPPARILRTRALPFSHSKLAKLGSYFTYYLSASWHALRTRPAPEVVVCMTTPPLLSLVGNLLQATRGARHVIWEMDLYPDIAVDLHVLSPTTPITRLLRTVANASRRRADAIIVLGEDMRDRLLAQGIPPEKLHICHNWADGHEIRPLPFPNGPLHLHYSGNLGLAHDTATIAAAIRHFSGNPDFQFTFTGGGPRRRDIPSTAQVEFRPYCGREELGASLGLGHIGLVTQNPATVGSVVPSKTYGILAAGRPLLYIGPPNATPARIIAEHNCGWQVSPGDVTGLIALLETLHHHRDLIAQTGARARQAFEAHYDRPNAVARFHQILASVTYREASTREEASDNHA